MESSAAPFDSRESDPEMRVKTRCSTGMVACVAGTWQPMWAMRTTRAVCQRYNRGICVVRLCLHPQVKVARASMVRCWLRGGYAAVTRLPYVGGLAAHVGPCKQDEVLLAVLHRHVVGDDAA